MHCPTVTATADYTINSGGYRIGTGDCTIDNADRFMNFSSTN